MATNTTVPQWAYDVKRKIEGGEAHTFLLTGNVHDYVINAAVGLEQYLSRMFSDRLVVRWSLASGLEFPLGVRQKQEFMRRLELIEDDQGGQASPTSIDPMAMLRQVERGNGGDVNTTNEQGDTLPPLPQDPSAIMALLDTLVTSPTKAGDKQPCVILYHPETIAPNAPMNQLALAERQAVIRFQEWSRDFAAFHPARGSGAIVFGVTDNPQALNEGIRGSGSRWAVLDIPLPGVEDRKVFWEYLLSDNRARKVVLDPSVTTQKAAYATAILGRQDIEDIALRVQQGDQVQMQDIQQRRDEIISQRYSGILRVVDPKVGFDAVAGLDEFKRYCRRYILQPLERGNLQRVPAGMMLMGAPGVGKTFVIEAIAYEAGLPLFFVEPSKIFDSLFGQSERNMEALISALEASAPCLVFIDEFEQFAPSRDGSATLTSDSVRRGVQTQWMRFVNDHGVKVKRGYASPVIAAYATNYPSQVDDAMTRAGRVDAKFLFPLPDANARAHLLRLGIGNTSASEAELAEVAASLELYTGAEVAQVAREAVATAEDRAYDEGEPWESRTVTLGDLTQAAQRVRRSTKGITAMIADALQYIDNREYLPAAYRALLDKQEEATDGRGDTALASLEGFERGA